MKTNQLIKKEIRETTLIVGVRVKHSQLLPELVSTMQNLSRQAIVAVAKGDWAALQWIGNDIKSAAAAFCLCPVSDLGSEIKKYARNNKSVMNSLLRLDLLPDQLEAEIESP